MRAATGCALKEHGEGFSVTASDGSVTLPDEATSLADAYRLADERMYGRKAICSRVDSGLS